MAEPEPIRFSSTPVGTFSPAPGSEVLLAQNTPSCFQGALLLLPPGPLPPLRVGMVLKSKDSTPLYRVLGCSWQAVPGPYGSERGERAWRLSCLTSQIQSPTQAPGAQTLTAGKDGTSLAWITLSDKGSRGDRTDQSGPRIETLIRQAMDVSLARGFLIPDDASELKTLLVHLALTEGFDLIVTTGGTGVGPRDITPETVLSLLEKQLPGFERAMTAASLAKTPHAMLSRAVAGTLGHSLIVTLPGSVKGVEENLESVLPAIPHAVAKLQGDPSDCARSHPARENSG